MKIKFLRFCAIITLLFLSVNQCCYAFPTKLYRDFLIHEGYAEIRQTNSGDFVYVPLNRPKSWVALAKKFADFYQKLPEPIIITTTGKECRSYWELIMCTSINRPWTKEEDFIVINKVKEIGPKWNLIGMLLNRSENNVKNRWYSVLRKKNLSDLLYFKDGPYEWKTQNASKVKLNTEVINKDIVYSYSECCGFFNNFLRFNSTTYHNVRYAPREIQKSVDQLTSLISSHNIDIDNIVFRGVDGFGMKILLEKYGINVDLDEIQQHPQKNPIFKLEGKTISDPAFLSTSDIRGLDFSTTYPFWDTGKTEHDRISNIVTNSLFVIELKKGQRALPTHKVIKEFNRLKGDCDDYEDEYEVILPPNQKLKIYKVIPESKSGIKDCKIIYCRAVD